MYDIVYNPVKTKLLKCAQEAGCITINGLGMLFYQGLFAYEIWTGIKIPEDLVRKLKAEFIKRFMESLK